MALRELGAREGASHRDHFITESVQNDSGSNIKAACNGNSATSQVSSSRVDVICPICHTSLTSIITLETHLCEEHAEMYQTVQRLGIAHWLETQSSVHASKAFISSLGSATNAQSHVSCIDDRILAPLQDKPVVHGVTAGSRKLNSHTRNITVSDRRHIEQRASLTSCEDCGKSFDEAQMSYQMGHSEGLSDIQRNGVRAIACQKCYESHTWHIQEDGAIRDHSDEFFTCRQKSLDKLQLRSNRLRKRLELMLNSIAHANQNRPRSLNFLSSFTSLGSAQRLIEQDIVPWDNDEKSLSCPYCGESYAFLGKHHCRLCGHLVCSSSDSKCSSIVSFTPSKLSKVTDGHSHAGQIKIRMCRECYSVLYKQEEIVSETEHIPAFIERHCALLSYKNAFEHHLQLYKGLLMTIASAPNTSAVEIEKATQSRIRLLKILTLYQQTTGKFEDASSPSLTVMTLYKAIHQNAMQFIMSNINLIRTVPWHLHVQEGSKHVTITEGQQDEVQIRMRDDLAVYIEQKFLLSEQLQETIRRRKFDEIQSLQVDLIFSCGTNVNNIVGLYQSLGFRDRGVAEQACDLVIDILQTKYDTWSKHAHKKFVHEPK